VSWTSGGREQTLAGNLEEIGTYAAVVSLEDPVPRGAHVRVNCHSNQLKGFVRACRFEPYLGYMVEVKLDAASRWNARWFTPEHLLGLLRGFEHRAIHLDVA
jgi:hypothetical protein